MFIGNEFVDIKDARDVQVMLKQHGFENPQELVDVILSLNAAEFPCVEGLINDDKWEQERAIADCVQGLEEVVDNLRANSRKGNTRADLANRLESIGSEIADLGSWCQVYDSRDMMYAEPITYSRKYH